MSENDTKEPWKADDQVYTDEHLAAAYLALTRMGQGLRLTNTGEVVRLMKKHLAPALADPKKQEIARRQLTYFEAWHEFREKLKVIGVLKIPEQIEEMMRPNAGEKGESQ